MAAYFSRPRHGRRPPVVNHFDHALSIAHRWFLDRVGQVATIQYVTVPVNLDWWQQDSTPPLVTGGLASDGTVALTLHRKFIELRTPPHALQPELLYELLVTEWAALTGQTPSQVDPQL